MIKGEFKMIKPLILIVVYLLLVFYLYKVKILTANRLDILYKSMAIAGIIAAIFTLWFNFLSPVVPELIIGERTIFIWHDKALKRAPMIDIFCTISNSGAKPLVINKLTVELWKDNSKTEFIDFLFLKLNGSQWQTEEYSHPILVNKYSDKSIMVGFKNDNLSYVFTEGKYILKVKAFKNDTQIVVDKVEFILSKEAVDKISATKTSESSTYVEIILK
jgi:hypothetical protein